MNAYEKLDFKRLTWQKFEDLCAELLEAEGFKNVKKLGRGAIGGDIVADEPLTRSPSGRQEVRRWLVQCKNYAVSGKSVPLKELGVMTSALKPHGAQVLLLITSTGPSGPTSQALEDFDQDGSHQYHAEWWDRLGLCTRLVRHPELVGRFFGSEAKAWAVEQQEGLNWTALREEYLEAVRERYRGLQLRGLAPQLIEGPTDLLLPAVYVPLKLVKGLEPQPEFEPCEPMARPRGIQPTDIREDQSEIPGLTRDGAYSRKDEELIEYEPIQRDKGVREVATPVANIWDGLALGRTAVVGEPGAGNTTTVRYLALALAREPGAKVDPRFIGRLPIVARLAKYCRRLESEPALSLFFAHYQLNREQSSPT